MSQVKNIWEDDILVLSGKPEAGWWNVREGNAWAGNSLYCTQLYIYVKDFEVDFDTFIWEDTEII